MGYRKFRDRDGGGWEIRDLSDRAWTFRPLRGNGGREVRVTPPPRIDDPFELSAEELQKLLDGSRSSRPTRPPRSPFLDDLE
ncbi:MAG: hypothetical protein Q8W51_08330 [Candidatus Palauibacterales bacterium]|nr:hypothetical protein [Candidatus Palauibacterales bacterium]MDP2529731.1 hypothetical protein [Candidatus Palauibacterales bacterium]MDP2584424.1 hypothetical protein [Candidatus Palauibacterales bacterium]